MANFAGFEIETPQEMLTRLNAQRAKIMSGNDVNAINFEATDGILKAIFGDPEKELAGSRTDAATAAFADTEQMEGEDDIAFRQRQVQTFFDEVKHTDPALAAQAAEELTSIQNERVERDMLMSQEERRKSNEQRLADQERDRQEDRSRKNVFNNLGYAYDRRTGKATAFNLSTPEGKAKLVEASKNPDTTVLTREEMANMDERKAREADSRYWNNSDRSEKIGTYEATFDSYNRVGRMMEIVGTEPDTLTTVAGIEKAISNLEAEVGAFENATGADLTMIEKWRGRLKQEVDAAARARGVTDSMLLSVAYSWAKAKDPGGRLSDKDLDLAIQMVGGKNANPTIFARTVLEEMELQSKKLEDGAELWNEDPSFRKSIDGRLLEKAHTMLGEKRENLRGVVRQHLPEAEYNEIVHGIPAKPAGVTPQVNPENGPAQIRIKGIDY